MRLMSEAAEDEQDRAEAQWLEDILEDQRECACGALVRGGGVCGACAEDEIRRFEEFKAECKEQPHE